MAARSLTAEELHSDFRDRGHGWCWQNRTRPSICPVDQNAYVGGICWLEAREQNVGTQIVDFASIHLGLNPPETLKDLTAQIRWCWQRWNPGEVLVIFNDVADYAHIKPYIPPARFRVLMTTRLQLLKDSERLELNVIRPEAALSLLELLVGVGRVQVEPAIARDICQRLGYLPRGLELVGRYLARKPDLSLAEMLERLQAERLDHKSLRKPRSESEMTAQLGVAAAFELSWNEQSPIAQELACLLSLFAVVPLPWDLIKQCLPEHDLENLEEARDDFLLAFHLLQYEGKGVYKLHELIQEFFQSKLVELSPADNLRQAITLGIGAIAQRLSIPSLYALAALTIRSGA